MSSNPTGSPEIVAAQCYRCGYDLRGLPADGQCPECGELIATSILALEERQRRWPALSDDRRWRRAVREGLGLAILVFGLMVLLALASVLRDGWAYEWKSPQRKWTLGVACTLWVLSWAAAWKLTAREPRTDGRNDGWRRALRVSATIYLAIPFLLGPQLATTWIPAMPTDMVIWLVIACALAGLWMAVAWFVYLARLARRAGVAVIPMLARFLAVLVALLFVTSVLMPELDGAEDSLTVLLSVPIPQFCTTRWISEFVYVLASGQRTGLTLDGLMLIVGVSVAVNIAMFVILRPSGSRVAEEKP